MKLGCTGKLVKTLLKTSLPTRVERFSCFSSPFPVAMVTETFCLFVEDLSAFHKFVILCYANLLSLSLRCLSRAG